MLLFSDLCNQRTLQPSLFFLYYPQLSISISNKITEAQREIRTSLQLGPNPPQTQIQLESFSSLPYPAELRCPRDKASPSFLIFSLDPLLSFENTQHTHTSWTYHKAHSFLTQFNKGIDPYNPDMEQDYPGPFRCCLHKATIFHFL